MVVLTDCAQYIMSIVATIIINKIKYPAILAECESIQTCESIPITKNNKLFNFYAGAGHWVYFLGIAKFIQEENYDLTDTDFIGTSAGALASSACVYKVPPDDMLEQTLLHLERCRGCWFNYSGYWLSSCRTVVLNLCSRLQTMQPITNNYVGVSKMTRHGLRKRYFSGELAPDGLATALQTSCWIPFFTAPIFQPFLRVCNALYCDGFLTGKDKCHHAKQLIIYPNKLEPLPLYTYWLWTGQEYNKRLYKLGYEHAKKHRKLFDDFFPIRHL